MVIDRKPIFVIFGIPISLLILFISIVPMVNLTNVSDVINSTVTPEKLHQFHMDFAPFDWAIFFGLLSIAFAIWFGFGDKLRDFLDASKKSEIDQKIAMMYGYA